MLSGAGQQFLGCFLSCSGTEKVLVLKCRDGRSRSTFDNIKRQAISEGVAMRVSNKFSARSLRSLAPSALVLGLAVTSAGATTINDVFVTSGSCGQSGCVDFSVSGLTQAQITAATNQIASYYSNNVTINILFGGSTGIGNGAESFNGFWANTYSRYTTLLTNNSNSNPLNTVLASAVANFSHGNGATGNLVGAPVVETSAALRANGRASATALYDSNGNFVSSGGAGLTQSCCSGLGPPLLPPCMKLMKLWVPEVRAPPSAGSIARLQVVVLV
jgi:hypothetical protein